MAAGSSRYTSGEQKDVLNEEGSISRSVPPGVRQNAAGKWLAEYRRGAAPRKWLGSFNSQEEAIRAYEAREQQLGHPSWREKYTGAGKRKAEVSSSEPSKRTSHKQHKPPADAMRTAPANPPPSPPPPAPDAATSERPVGDVCDFRIVHVCDLEHHVHLERIANEQSAVLYGKLHPHEKDRTILGYVRDWAISFGQHEPNVWAVTEDGWYRLTYPARSYATAFKPVHEKLDLLARCISVGASRSDVQSDPKAAVRAVLTRDGRQYSPEEVAQHRDFIVAQLRAASAGDALPCDRRTAESLAHALENASSTRAHSASASSQQQGRTEQQRTPSSKAQHRQKSYEKQNATKPDHIDIESEDSEETLQEKPAACGGKYNEDDAQSKHENGQVPHHGQQEQAEEICLEDVDTDMLQSMKQQLQLQPEEATDKQKSLLGKINAELARRCRTE